MKKPNPLVIALALILLTAFQVGSARADGIEEINVSYVKAPFNLQIMVMKSQGLLEKEFARDGIKINWHEIVSGAKQAQAMAARSLDIGSVMNSTSVLLANAGGNPVRIIGGVSRPEKTFAIVGRPNGPKSVAQLRGKIVAGPKGTVLHQLLVAALAREGMKESDIKFVSMGLAKARTAMLSGQVDAALLAASLVIKSTAAGATVLTTADGLVTPKLVSAVRLGFMTERPDLVARYLKVFRQAMDFVIKHPQKALDIGIKEHGISRADGQTLSDWAGFTTHLVKADIDSMRDDLAFLTEHGMLNKEVNPALVCLPSAFME